MYHIIHLLEILLCILHIFNSVLFIAGTVIIHQDNPAIKDQCFNLNLILNCSSSKSIYKEIADLLKAKLGIRMLELYACNNRIVNREIINPNCVG